MIATEPKGDFAGFIDGFQARNLASIQRSVATQLSEINTRLAIIRKTLRDDPNFGLQTKLKTIDETLQTREPNVVKKMLAMAELLEEAIVTHVDQLLSNKVVRHQITGIVDAFISCAMASRADPLIDSALQLGETVSRLITASPSLAPA